MRLGLFVGDSEAVGDGSLRFAACEVGFQEVRGPADYESLGSGPSALPLSRRAFAQRCVCVRATKWDCSRDRHRPDCMMGESGYDAEAIRQSLRG